MKSFSIMLLLLSAALCANVMMADNVNQKSLMSKLPKKGKIVKESFNEALGAKDLELSNGVRVLLKHTDYEPDNIWMHATQRGGSSLYGEKDWANCERFNAIIKASGLGGLSNKELKQALDGKNIEMGFSMDTYEDALLGLIHC